MVSSGSQLPVSLKAFSPASTSFQAIDLPCLAAAASRTSFAAGQMSTPVPSPSMKGMMGSSETARVPSSRHRDLVGHGNQHYWHTRGGRSGPFPVDFRYRWRARGRDNDARVNGSGGRPANLIGRERELAIARAALGTSRSRGVLLVGDAGVGKTSLARAALDELATRPGHETLWLVASAVEPSIPFGAFAPFVPEIGGKPGRQPDTFYSPAGGEAGHRRLRRREAAGHRGG